MTGSNAATTTCNATASVNLARSSFPERNVIDLNKTIQDIPHALEWIVAAIAPVHPFSTGLSCANYEPVMRNYFAMSQAFPLIQASACSELLMDTLRTGADIPIEFEITTVVGAFLTWDETGGAYVLQQGGKENLPKILNTGRQFHSNLLRADLEKIGGINVSPDYSPTTVRYLQELSKDLSSLDHVRRCAAMVAFELHAESMISALWDSISALTPVPKDDLIYFKVHVGGDDPAEKYHKQMTHQMIEKLVPDARLKDFLDYFAQAYKLHTNWCESIKRLA